MNQRGAGAILGLCILFVILWIGMVLFDLSKTENSISAGLANGIIAQNLAESGAHYAIAQLKIDKEFTGAENSVMIEEKQVLRSEQTVFRKGKYRVYITGAAANRMILSVGEAGQEKRQIVVHIQLSDENKPFSVLRWNNE